MTNEEDVVKFIVDSEIKYVDLRFTDMRGKWQHLTFDASVVDEDFLEEGTMFDGSSIAGWKAINDSDMLIRPDCASAVQDPFTADPTLIMTCNVLEPATDQPYERDPRSVAIKAESYLKASGVGDVAYVGPEAEFFLFDDVRCAADPYNVSFSVDSLEFPVNSNRVYEGGNMGHRIGIKEGYFPVQPQDSAHDIRSEMLAALQSMGLSVEKHHHEVASGQHELGVKYNQLVKMADQMQIYKYCIHNVAQSYGKTATFMPKPVYGDNGSGMHCHLSLFRDGKPLFAGDAYNGLSTTCLHFIGGIIKHAKAVNAFTNPTTNSYKRLVPGFEAPVLLAYSGRNRSAACRIPWATSPVGKRVEVRFPDPTANPYLAFAALLMAGLDGVLNKIHPGDAIDKDLYDMPPQELEGVPTVSASLREALGSLDEDRAFLKAGGVFTDDFLNAYIKLKMDEVVRLDQTPHPVEYVMYYSS